TMPTRTSRCWDSLTPESLTSLHDVIVTTHTNAGTYATDAWAFAGNSNYNATSGTVSDSIAKANAVIVVTPYSVTYNGVAHTATGTASGVESPPSLYTTRFRSLSGTTHTNAGTYATDAWAF